jgi:hypothetical protein
VHPPLSIIGRTGRKPCRFRPVNSALGITEEVAVLPKLRFLHSMRRREYLESALTSGGLMYTDHEASYSPSNSRDDWQSLLNEVMPLLQRRLEAIGAPWGSLSEEQRRTMMRGLGSIRGKIPMICFTEVQEGRDLAVHHLSFGGYGLVVTQDWLERQGGDRVIYVGNKSSVSHNLYRNIAALLASNIVVTPGGDVAFCSFCFHSILDLMAYTERRDNLVEFEWRIAGRHGFNGERRVTGQRVPLSLQDIERVLVQQDEDIAYFEAILMGLPGGSTMSRLPKVVCQPPVLGAA